MKTARLRPPSGPAGRKVGPVRRRPSNAPGKYFTTLECDGCAYCASVAPENFDYDKDSNSYYIARQPRDRAEEDLVIEALEDCPLDAIAASTEELMFAR